MMSSGSEANRTLSSFSLRSRRRREEGRQDCEDDDSVGDDDGVGGDIGDGGGWVEKEDEGWRLGWAFVVDEDDEDDESIIFFLDLEEWLELGFLILFELL